MVEDKIKTCEAWLASRADPGSKDNTPFVLETSSKMMFLTCGITGNVHERTQLLSAVGSIPNFPWLYVQCACRLQAAKIFE
mmetsp:Transcript_63217/g.147256  ORF Transcript_63217/g.147256 Transcript_63217/m.147256 type:complete len:81 (-) Transcript_63217:75-317(-)